MTSPLRFDPAAAIPKGRSIIEASAGTGKTFTISALATRLIAIDGVPLDRILIVTFTRAATAELKDRVRDRMATTLEVLTGRQPPDPDDSFMAIYTDVDGDDRLQASARIRRALADFDRSQIFTIHGFAHRLLGQLGFRVPIPETLEPGEVDDLVLVQTAADVVAEYMATAGPDDPTVEAKAVAKTARLIHAHPDADIVEAPPGTDPEVATRIELGEKVAREAKRRMWVNGTISYDDGLLEVLEALKRDDTTDLLARRYDIALIDESQDTDPIQWRILRRIFDRSKLVVIGDPKQSIYAFRGADIESYLAATRGAADHRTLDTNWRSDGPLVDALDLLFDRATFGSDDIAYRQVTPAPGREEGRIRGVDAPVRIRNVAWGLPLGTYKSEPYYRVGPLRDLVAADVAAEIVRLLSASVSIGDQKEGWRPLTPADIAVLCRTGAQVENVRGELRRRKVPSVSPRAGAVLDTPAAEEWRRFLLALERPEQLSLARGAAATRLMGWSLPELAILDDEASLALQRQFREWQRTLDEEGVPALVAALERDTNLTGRILADSDGERLLTDLLHVAEEMHLVWRRGRHGSLATWLQTAMTEARERTKASIEEPDSRQRRLETDAEAVTVQTIHGAKGLEYPVVLVPFAWDTTVRDPHYPVTHDPDQTADPSTPRRRLLHLSGPGSPDYQQFVTMAVEEAHAEESRLLYVALTRARHHLIVWWAENHKRIDEVKITELLTGGDRTPQSLAARSRGTIGVSTVDEMPAETSYQPPPPKDGALDVARFDRPTDHAWRRASFSSLAARQPLSPSEEMEEEVLRSDEGEVTEEEETVPAPAAATQSLLAEMPRGARFGTLVHDILEQLRFDAVDLDGEVERLLNEHTRTTTWDFDPVAFVGGIRAAVETPLGPDPTDPALADLDNRDLLRELDFELPVREQGGAVTPGDIAAVMEAHLSSTDPYLPYLEDLARSPAGAFRGYLAGAIDLVARMPNGHYVVMDYKSNAIGHGGTHPYGPASLAEEMVSHRYVLQATLYQVALHRFLQWRLPGYHPERHLGGSIYLFIRGMAGRDTPVVDGERAGVARWHPPVDMIVALSRLFAGDRG